MQAIFKNATVCFDGVVVKQDMLLDGAALSVFRGNDDATSFANSVPVFHNAVILPGFCDVHVHLREPGFSYKETVASGTQACAHGGYTAVCSMPNLKPAPDCPENLRPQLDAIARDGVIPVHPYGTITKLQAGIELSDMAGMRDDAIAYSDDGRGVQDEGLMEQAMLTAKSLGKLIVAHCEDNSLLRGGYIHDGEYARAHGHAGICSQSEWGPIKRDLELVRKTGCGYHVCHVSTKESVELIRRAKAEGLDVTCETAPHYLVMDDSMLEEDGRFKMNPPIRGREDREALLRGLIDGAVDMIATDHAPHSSEEKSRGLQGSLMGVVGIETAFPILYTNLVETGVIGLERLVEAMSTLPRERFGIGTDPGFTIFDVGEEYEIDPEQFLSMGRSTPFKGWRVKGRCLATVVDGRCAYLAPELADGNERV